MQEISGSLSEVIRAYSDHNLLVPAATDVQLNPFYKYHVEEVAVDLSENSGDIFKVGSVKTGKTDSKGNDIWQDTYSLSKPLLNKLAMAAGIQFNPHQTYGRRIDSITYRAQAQGAMRKADGTYRSEVDQKEICLEDDPRYFNTPWLIDNYFRSYRKYPFIEQLLKVGFYRMTREFLEDNRVNAIEFNASQRTVLGTLDIGKIQYNMLRKLEDPAIRDLEILRYKPDLKWEEFNDLRYIRDNGHIDMYKKYIDLMAYTTLHKIIRYISEQKLTTRDNDYFDYTGWLEEMGYDMRNEFNLFPKDFQKILTKCLMYTVSIVANYRKKIRDAIRLLKPFTYQRRQ